MLVMTRCDGSRDFFNLHSDPLLFHDLVVYLCVCTCVNSTMVLLLVSKWRVFFGDCVSFLQKVNSLLIWQPIMNDDVLIVIDRDGRVNKCIYHLEDGSTIIG
jgi:hypothetical protein